MAAGEEHEPTDMPSLAVPPRADALQRLQRQTGPGGQPRLRLLVFPQKLVDRHADRNSGRLSHAQVTCDSKTSPLVVPYHFPRGGDMKTDEELAQEILCRLFPRGKWREGAELTGIETKTFQRIVKGETSIKAKNWAILHDYEPFELEWVKAKKGQEPQFDLKTKEQFGRLALAFGPRNLSVLVSMLETISARVGAEKTLSAVEKLEGITLELSESATVSAPGQKIL